MVKLQLPRLLYERQWTQAELVRRTGIRANTISDLYNGVAERIGFDQLDKMCEAFNCPLEELIVRIPNKTSRNPDHDDPAGQKSKR